MPPLSKIASWVFLSACHALGMRSKTEDGPIFVVSQPRSGSSWIGAGLGVAGNALYFREPFTRPFAAAPANADASVVFDVSEGALPVQYAKAARQFEAASPCIRPTVVAHAQQWPPFSSRTRIPLVKEVNPLACRWYLERFKPRAIVMLVRHPAGIATSMQQMGWTLDGREASEDEWRRFGARIAGEMQQMLEQVAGHSCVRILRYEDVCEDPLTSFKALYNELGLEWGEESERWIQGSTQTTAGGSYSTQRDSAKNAWKWRKKVTDAQYRALMEGYGSVTLPPWYTE